MADKDLYKIYGWGMRLLGYDRSISNFIKKLNVHCPVDSKILDVGCGTGVVGLSLMEKIPKASLLATDLDQRLLHQVMANAKEYRLDKSRVSVGLSDVTSPDNVTLTDSSILLKQKHFDIVSASGTIGYSKNQEKTIRKLLSLIKPGGYFIDMEMNEHLFARLVAYRYQYSIMSISNMKRIIESEGYSVEIIPLTFKNFPANLTRLCIIAQRS